MIEDNGNIDIIIVARNESRHLKRCFESVMKARETFERRTGKNVIISYVDSYSTDNSVEIAKQYNLQIFYPPNWYFNCSNGRTTGFLLTKNEYVMFLDGDMELRESWLFDGVSFLQTEKTSAGVAGVRDDMRLLGDDFLHIPNYNCISKPVELITNDVGGAFLFRRDVLAQIGGFEPSVAPEEDYVCYAQLKLKGWDLHRINKPMITHWDTKIAGMRDIMNHLMFSSKALVPGAIFRYAVFNTRWWPYLLKLKRDLIIQGVWLAVLFFTRPLFVPVLVTLCYVFSIWLQKRDYARTFTSLFLRTIYLINFMAGFILNYPKMEFGLQNEIRYKNEVKRINDSRN